MTVWRCRVCGTIADHDGPPPRWYGLRLLGGAESTYASPTLGVMCSEECLLVATMRPFGMTEPDVRAWVDEMRTWIADAVAASAGG